MTMDLLAYQSARSEAQQLNRQADINARQSDVEVTAMEADRRRALADAIATSRASAAGRGGSAFEGSPLTAAREMSRRSSIEGQRTRYAGRIGQLAEKYKARVQGGQLKTQAAIGILRSVESAATSAATGGAAPVSSAKRTPSYTKGQGSAPGTIK